MDETEDPIRRAAELPPPTSTDVLLLYTLRLAVDGKPKRLDRWLGMARDNATAAEIIQLHGKGDDPDWRTAFRNAGVRAESVAAMLRAEMEAEPKARKRGKK